MGKIVFICILVVISSSANAQNKTAATETIKKVSAKDLKAIMDTTTAPLIINFWASWCGPCIREIPWFDSIISIKNLPVKLLLVSLDLPSMYPAYLTAFAEKQGYRGEIVFLNETDPGYFIPQIEKKWKGEIPASIFINNPRKYYQVFNQQLPPKRFELELDKLVN